MVRLLEKNQAWDKLYHCDYDLNTELPHHYHFQVDPRGKVEIVTDPEEQLHQHQAKNDEQIKIMEQLH